MKMTRAILTGFLFLTVQESRAADISNVTIASISSTTLSFNWQIPAVSTPTVVLSSNNFATTISSASVTLAQNSTSYTNLTPNTTYYFQVKNSTETDTSYVSFNANKSTVTWAQRPSAGAFGNVTPTTIQANWTATGNPIPTLYAISASTSSDFFGIRTVAYSTATVGRVTGLRPSTTYYLGVQAINHAGILTEMTNLGAKKTMAIPNASSYVVSANTLKAAAVTGGNVTTLVYDPNNSNTVYAGVKGGGLFKSLDDGSSWSQIFLPSLGEHNPNQVLVSSKTADLVFVCENNEAAIWKSADGGTSFSNSLDSDRGANTCAAITEGITAGTYYAGVYSSIPTPPSGATIVSNIYKTTDSGAAWSKLSFSTTNVVIAGLIQLPSGRLVMGTFSGAPGNVDANRSGGLYYSDNESSWTQVNGSTQAFFGFALKAPNTLYLATYDNALIHISSSANGSDWSFNIATYTAQVNSVYQQPLIYHAGSDTFFITDGSIIFQSGNAGAGYNWPGFNTIITAKNAPNLVLGAPTAFVVDPDDVNAILQTGTGDGIFKTVDKGKTWDSANTGLYAQSVEFAMKSSSTSYIYAASQMGFVYFSTGSLNTWTKVYRSSTNAVLHGMAYDLANPKKLVVSLGIYNGLPETYPPHLIANDDLTTTSEDAQPFNHAGWYNVLMPTTTAHPILALLVEGTTMYAGVSPATNTATGQYLYRSTNSAASWSLLSLQTKGGLRSLEFDPSDHRVIYAGSGDFAGHRLVTRNANGLFKSTDSGNSWSWLNSDATLNAESPRKIIIDTVTVSRVWVVADPTTANSAGPADIWESADSGVNWAKLTPVNGSWGFDVTYISSLKSLFLAQSGTGINVYYLEPQTCDGNCRWSEAFGVYGRPQALYSGSIGIGSSTGLFEAPTFTISSSTGTLAADVVRVRVYPNPLRPSLGHTIMTFDHLPANAMIKIYSFAGELITELTSNSSGVATWDATNQSGRKVASGVYFCFAEGAGTHLTFKAAVQR